MRETHDGKPFRAVFGNLSGWYLRSMEKTSRLSLTLRATAAAAILAVSGLWLATGSHFGWTQTSKVIQQHDEITGIEYPVRVPTFVAGVEVLGVGVTVAAVLGGASFFTNRRRAVNA